jgi:hypothetical protein
MVVATIIWIIWGIVSFAWFGIAEYMALSNKHEGDTLSENLRVLIGKHKALWYATLIIWIIFSSWFLGHIWFSFL